MTSSTDPRKTKQIFFLLFHWVKGSPDTFSQGEFNGLTLWEQLDNGTPWTRTKKVFFLVPTMLCVAGPDKVDVAWFGF